jgi:hypothetical protein
MPLPNLTGFALLDEKGHSVPLTDVTNTDSVRGNTVTRQLTLTFLPNKEHGDPIKLRFTAARIATVDVPFALHDVPLR